MRRKLQFLCLLLSLVLGVVVLPACSRGVQDATKTTEGNATESVGREATSEEASNEVPDETPEAKPETSTDIEEDGTYTSKEEVALYIHTYGHLPDNFVTKDEAEDAGWKTEGLTLDEACPGKSIGGDRFGNREGRLPKAKGRTWYECDIDYHGQKSRNAKRIVYSNDGLVYYTEDHYKSFEQLY